MIELRKIRCVLAILTALAVLAPCAQAAERITLKNGFELDCARREAVGDRVRLYLTPGTSTAGYMEVGAETIVRVEVLPAPIGMSAVATPAESSLSIPELLARAGAAHRIDSDMLASVIKAESGGQVRAVSRAGARGLMQLMPATAEQLGVADAFRADQNIAGGTAYLDRLLTRYHDDIALALAAYNAGPAAVDRWHGIPPYRETQAYVARVIREFNRRKLLAMTVPAMAIPATGAAIR